MEHMPIWFLRRRKAFNALGGDMSIWPFVVVIFLFAVTNILSLTSTQVTTSALALLFQFIGAIVILVQSFDVKDIFENVSQTDEGDFLPHEPLSGLLTFVATIFYLQHKINVMDAVDAKTPPLGSRLMLWGSAFAGLVGVMLVIGGIGTVQNYTAFTEQLRTILQSNTVIMEHIGNIETLETDWAASGETAENVLVFNIGGNKGAGSVTVEFQEAQEVALASGSLVMSSGERYELVPPP